MPSELVTPYLTCRFTIIDIRQWDAETLLKSPYSADAVLAILCRHSDRLETIRRILQRIDKMKESSRKIAFSKLMILAGIRRLAGVVQQEAKHMPITEDIMDHEIIGPAIRKGLKQGIAQGLAQGRAQGMAEGKAEGKAEEAVSLLQRQIAARFGTLSPTTKRRLAKLTLPELEDLAVRILSANTLNELFHR
jgi:predicted transposase YdaD